jgi:hypothetical protein
MECRNARAASYYLLLILLASVPCFRRDAFDFCFNRELFDHMHVHVSIRVFGTLKA